MRTSRTIELAKRSAAVFWVSRYLPVAMIWVTIRKAAIPLWCLLGGYTESCEARRCRRLLRIACGRRRNLPDGTPPFWQRFLARARGCTGFSEVPLLLSFLLHVLAAGLLFMSSTFIVTHRRQIRQQVVGLVTDISPYVLPASAIKAGGGGGGGDRDKLPASRGALPKLSRQQITPQPWSSAIRTRNCGLNRQWWSRRPWARGLKPMPFQTARAQVYAQLFLVRGA